MGRGVWFKNIISINKSKGDKLRKLKRYNTASQTTNGCTEELCSVNVAPVDTKIEYEAAVMIQTAYRAYAARRSIRRMRGTSRLQNMVQRDSVKNQASSTLSHLHSWTKTQAQIKARRANMVIEGRLRQKKLENQLKLEAKLHDFEVEWNGGAETVTEALAKIYQREEASVRRERAMAYAFTHQWRACTFPSFGSSNKELSKANWGWSWMDRWIAARPWESRVAALNSTKKLRAPKPKKPVKDTFSPTGKVKGISPNGKTQRKARKLSYEAAAVNKVSTKTEEEITENAKESS